ncbi:hypothetical protein EV177_008245 [Coemansia sp. RSA 1804]|nr:hypothetical protein EV177_008245 [Coemansia sp. RSA 1804]
MFSDRPSIHDEDNRSRNHGIIDNSKSKSNGNGNGNGNNISYSNGNGDYSNTFGGYAMAGNLSTKTPSRSSSSLQVEDLFSEDPRVIQASRRIRRILYRRRAQETANWRPLRRFLHITFYEPSSMRARAYMAFSTCVVLLFLIVFMIDTFPQYRIRAHWRTIADTVNLSTAAYFAVEWLLRFYSFRRRFRYLLEPMTIVDLLGIIPGFVYYTGDSAHSFGRVKWLRALQVLRVLRLLRLTEYSIELYVTVRTLKKSVGQIVVVMMVVVALLLTACFLLFFAENDFLDQANVQWMRRSHGVAEVSPFQNVFFCLYWGIVTITTVGYGDYTPTSPWGQVIACLTMLMGVFTIVFPTSIISNNFATEWEAFRKAQKIHEQRKLEHEYRRKRSDLERVWCYAQQNHGAADSSPQPLIAANNDGDGSEKSRATPVATQVHYEDQASPIQKPQSPLSCGSYYFHSHKDRSDTGGDPEGMKMGPQEYGRMVDFGKRFEDELGIPGAAIDDINADDNVNKNLAISAMYSKLYNDAFTTLCERMLGRLIEYNELATVDETVDYLQTQPNTKKYVRSWPHNKQLSVLEYKLLCYVLDRLNTRNDADYQNNNDGEGAGSQPAGTSAEHRSNGSRVQSPGSDDHRQHGVFGSKASSLLPSRKGIRRRLKSRFKHVYDHIPTPSSSHGGSSSSQPSLYNFISSGKKPNHCYRHNHNHSVSQTQMPAESSANMPDPGSNIPGQHSHPSSSPDMVIDMPPPSDKEDDSQPAVARKK